MKKVKVKDQDQNDTDSSRRCSSESEFDPMFAVANFNVVY